MMGHENLKYGTKAESSLTLLTRRLARDLPLAVLDAIFISRHTFNMKMEVKEITLVLFICQKSDTFLSFTVITLVLSMLSFALLSFTAAPQI